MSIEKTKELIAGWKDRYTESPKRELWVDAPGMKWYRTDLTIADIEALAVSHSKLLAAIKTLGKDVEGFEYDCEIDGSVCTEHAYNLTFFDGKCPIAVARTAIQEAEK